MKRLVVFLVAVIAVGTLFTACSKGSDTTSTEKTSSTKAQSETSTAVSETQQTTKQEATTESTTAKAYSPDFVYNGYWYEVGSNYVNAYKFNSNGSVQISVYRRKTLLGEGTKADSVKTGSYAISGNTLTVYPNGKDTDEAYAMDFNSDAKSLIYNNNDPEGASQIKLVNASSLSADYARELWMGDN